LDERCTTLVYCEYVQCEYVHCEYNEYPPLQRKSRSIRQSVTILAALAVEVKRMAKQQRLTVSRALVSLAERGVQAEQDKKDKLKKSFERFLNQRSPNKKDAAVKDLIRAIFGDNAIAENSVR